MQDADMFGVVSEDMAKASDMDAGGADLDMKAPEADATIVQDMLDDQGGPQDGGVDLQQDMKSDADMDSSVDMSPDQGDSTEALTHFVTTWKTDIQQPGNAQVTIPAGDGTFLYDVDWDNDGVFDDLGVTRQITHTYDDPGTYTVRIRGKFPHFDMSTYSNTNGPAGDYYKLVSVDQWGTQRWESMRGAFRTALNMTLEATDAPDLSGVTDMSNMFSKAVKLNSPLDHWDVSNVQNMERMFADASIFNQPLDSWDVSNVTSMKRMFSYTGAFDQPLSSWNTSNVTDMEGMFNYARAFNQPLNTWDVSSVTTTERMFEGAAYNQPLDQWDTSSLTNMNYMFISNTAFNQPVESWNISNVTEMRGAFYGATSFNQPLAQWDVSGVIRMDDLFRGATSFNQPLDQWDISSVQYMQAAFKDTTSFDRSLADWDMAGVSSVVEMLDGCGMSKAHYDETLIGWATQSGLTPNMSLGVKQLEYCAGASARSTLRTTYRWSFDGDTLRCDP